MVVSVGVSLPDAPHDKQSMEVVAFEILHETRHVHLSVILVNLIHTCFCYDYCINQAMSG